MRANRSILSAGILFTSTARQTDRHWDTHIDKLQWKYSPSTISWWCKKRMCPFFLSLCVLDRFVYLWVSLCVPYDKVVRRTSNLLFLYFGNFFHAIFVPCDPIIFEQSYMSYFHFRFQAFCLFAEKLEEERNCELKNETLFHLLDFTEM